ncbi:MAG: antitoxin [Bdellovibrio bacteriovorus]
MRTTLDIDDEVLTAAKEIARRRRSKAGAVISELARRALTQPAVEPSAAGGEPEPFFGYRPLAAGGRVVSEALVERLREEEGI